MTRKAGLILIFLLHLACALPTPGIGGKVRMNSSLMP